MPDPIDWQARCLTAEAENAALSLMVGELRGALYSFRIRVAFISHPGERFWDTGEGHMLPDWRDELQESETALALPLPESAKKAAAERAFCDAALVYAEAKATISDQADRYKTALAALRAARGRF